MDDKNLKQDENIEETTSEEVEESAESMTDNAVEDAPEEVVEASDDIIAEPEAESAEETVSEEDTAETKESTPEKKDEEELVEKGTSEKEVKTDDKKSDEPKKKSLKDLKGKWYIVHTYSGHENKVGKTLMQRVGSMGYEDRIFDAIVPTRETIRIRAGKKETIKEKIFPGYILVNMDLTDESWILVRTTPGVTSFVGAENKPTPIRDEEVAAIVEFVDRKEPIYKAQFSVGEAVKINDGPFSDFLGSVESIDQEKGKIKVLVSIFGRETPVELDFLQVTKI